MEIKIDNNSTPTKPFSFGFFVKIVIMSIAIIIAAYIFPGIKIEDPIAAVLAAIVISLLNTFLRPILLVLTLPFTLVTLGLFILIINASIIFITAKIVPGISVDSFWWALLLSLFITFVSYLLNIPAKMLNRSNQEDIDNSSSSNNNHFDDYEEITDDDNKKA